MIFGVIDTFKCGGPGVGRKIYDCSQESEIYIEELKCTVYDGYCCKTVVPTNVDNLRFSGLRLFGLGGIVFLDEAGNLTHYRNPCKCENMSSDDVYDLERILCWYEELKNGIEVKLLVLNEKKLDKSISCEILSLSDRLLDVNRIIDTIKEYLKVANKGSNKKMN